MDCIICGLQNVDIVYNTLYYCKSCFDESSKMLAIYENNVSISNVYIKPTQITENVFIGSINSVDENELKKLGITAIVIAGKKLRNKNHDNFNCLELLIDDSLEQILEQYFNIVFDYIENTIKNTNQKVLIHCHSGISRSGSILISYLMKKNKWSYEKTYSYVKDIYKQIYPNENFQNQLKTLYNNIQ